MYLCFLVAGCGALMESAQTLQALNSGVFPPLKGEELTVVCSAGARKMQHMHNYIGGSVRMLLR